MLMSDPAFHKPLNFTGYHGYHGSLPAMMESDRGTMDFYGLSILNDDW